MNGHSEILKIDSLISIITLLIKKVEFPQMSISISNNINTNQLKLSEY